MADEAGAEELSKQLAYKHRVTWHISIPFFRAPPLQHSTPLPPSRPERGHSSDWNLHNCKSHSNVCMCPTGSPISLVQCCASTSQANTQTCRNRAWPFCINPHSHADAQWMFWHTYVFYMYVATHLPSTQWMFLHNRSHNLLCPHRGCEICCILVIDVCIKQTYDLIQSRERGYCTCTVQWVHNP